MKTYTEKRFFEWHEDNVSVNIRASGGSYGGGSEVLVVYGFKPMQGAKAEGIGFEKEIAPTLSTSANCGGGY